MPVKNYIQKEKENLITMRRWFHSHPEISLEEYETCNKIEAELDSYGITHTRIGDTSIYATIKGKKGPGKIIALRSDIDALALIDLKDVAYKSKNDGACHACGHDAHTATLLVATKVLKEKEEEFSGEIRLFFQCAEEIGGGARLFINAGLLDGVDRVFGAHVNSSLDSGTISITPGAMNASCDYFKIDIKGKGAHVSTPQKGVDALYISSMIVQSLQSIVARTSDPREAVVVGIGVLRAGTQYNIIAEDAVIEGTTRTFDFITRKKTNEKVTKIAKSIAQMHNATATVTFKDFAAPLINDPEVAKEIYPIAKEIVGEDNVITNQEKMLGADDFADYLLKVKGVYAFIGTRNDNNVNTSMAHHHGLFDIDEEALLYACNLYVDYALVTLNTK